MKKILLIILALLLVQTSSMAIGSRSTMEKIMGSWIGEHIDAVMNKWGYPTTEKNSLNTLYMYGITVMFWLKIF